MVRHMYGLDFETCGINRDHTSPLLFSVKVYQIADFYRVSQLKQRVKEKADKAARTRAHGSMTLRRQISERRNEAACRFS